MDKKKVFEYVEKDRFLDGSNEKTSLLSVVCSNLLILLVALMSLLLIFVMLFQLCEVIGTSMQSTLEDGDHVLLSKIERKLEFGDIVVIEKTERNGTINIIKRVIGTEGDTLEFRQEDGKIELYRAAAGSTDLIKLTENYIKEPMKNFGGAYRPGVKFTIPPDCIFALGDNRNNSQDSRALNNGEYFTKKNVVGKVAYAVPRDSLLEKFLLIIFNAKQTTNTAIFQNKTAFQLDI